ncbi:Lrp/AsnC family transcriptional regulator [Candidatus Woesearchaeota archaeon]|nr:Lrp/AsnC family transcriptional regulator [Candidatus Woesearchaeota archaeon]
MEKILDLKNRKILSELEQDSRQSLNQIAKKVGLKKETVFHRIKKLEESGIIKKYLTEINLYKLGFQLYPLLLRFQNTTPQIEQEIVNYFQNSNYTGWLAKCEGAWDLNATLVARGNFELQKFLDKFLEKYSDYIADKHIFITTEIHYFKGGLWLNRRTTKTISTGGEDLMKTDEMDLKLLKILSTKARMPLVELGKRFNTDPKNIAYRIKKLEQQKIIQGSRILVDFSKMGYQFYKVWFSLKNLNPENLKKLINYFKENPRIIWATKFIGAYDLSCEMEVKDVEEFRSILEDIKTRFSHIIKKQESLLIFEEIVLNYLPNS